MAKALRQVRAATEATIDLGALVDRFPGPACVVDAERQLLSVNALWEALGLAAPGDRRPLPGEVAASAFAASRTGRPQRLVTTVVGEGGARASVDIACLPCWLGDQPAVILLGNDLSEIEALERALTDSRNFHRDLALCSTDATFEIDATGRFTYVGPAGLLGRADFELHGSQIRDLIAARSRTAAELVLTAREPVFEAELWFASPGGTDRCFMISAMPVFAADGAWSGLRGVVREVTDERAREAEVTKARQAQRRVDAVLYAMRTEARPATMIAAGAAAALDSVEIDACIVAHARGGLFDRIEARAQAYDRQFGGNRRAAADPVLLRLCARCIDHPEDALHTYEVDGHAVIIALTRYGGKVNGAVMFVRNGDESDADPWNEGDRHLLRAMAVQMSVALAQRELFETPPGSGA